jgi:hypothetical protein
MDKSEVPLENRVLYVNMDLEVALNHALNRRWGSDDNVNTQLRGYNGMKLVYVPPTRFNTKIKLNPGTDDTWGYGLTGKNINFMIIQPDAIVQVVKLMLPKIFTPDENQKSDGWLFQFRLYHDCFMYENKRKGVCLCETV